MFNIKVGCFGGACGILNGSSVRIVLVCVFRSACRSRVRVACGPIGIYIGTNRAVGALSKLVLPRPIVVYVVYIVYRDRRRIPPSTKVVS